jgi:hypothetical protein
MAAAAVSAISAALLLSCPTQATVMSSTIALAAAAPAAAGSDDFAARADVDINGIVDVNDILLAIDEYGDACVLIPCRADTNRDENVNMFDLLQILAHYGAVIPAHVDGDVQTLLSGTHLVEQSRYADDAESLRSAGVKNDAWMLHGYAVAAPKGMSEADFLDASEDDVRESLLSYIDNKPDLDPATSDYVILDIEHPIHPKNFGKYLSPMDERYDPAQFVRIMIAFRLRISVARDLLPNARLGLYGVTTPHPFGDASLASQITRQGGFLAASAAGLYDELDVLCPVVYQRFGPNDARYEDMESYTQLGVDSASLERHQPRDHANHVTGHLQWRFDRPLAADHD